VAHPQGVGVTGCIRAEDSHPRAALC
jgi:hypothetical protein